MTADLTRRAFSCFALCVGLPSRGAQSGFAGASPDIASRVVALDWGVAETIVALGRPPLAAAEIASYDRTVVTPLMPKSVVDVGLRLAPNPELMQSLKPDLILINPAQTYMKQSLAPFGRVEIVPIYTKAGDPYRLSREAALHLAEYVGDPDAASRLFDSVDVAMAEARAKLSNYDGRPIYAIDFDDGRHISVAGRTSLLQGVFDQLGLQNAYRGVSGAWGLSEVGIEALADAPEARVVYFEPLSEEAKRTVASNPLWLRLPFVREHRVVALPPIWMFGALATAMRFARMLGDALGTPGPANG